MLSLRLRYILVGCLVLLLTLGTGRSLAQGSGHQQTENSCVLSDKGQFSLVQAQQLYKNGCYVAATTVLETISQQNDALSQAIAFSNLSLTHQQLGNWEQAATAINRAFERIALAKSGNRAAIQAQALDVQGQLQLATGQVDAAAFSWQRASQLYTQLGQANQSALSQIKRARALQTLGLFHQVQVVLKNVEQSLRQQSTASELRAVALRQLADALWMTGNTEVVELDHETSGEDVPNQTVRSLLSESWQIGQELDRADIKNAATLSLGNFYRYLFSRDISQPNIQTVAAYNDLISALYAYQQVTSQDSTNNLLTLQSRLNQLSLLTELAFSADSTKSGQLKNRSLSEWLQTTSRLPDTQQMVLRNLTAPSALDSLYNNIKGQLDLLTPGRQTIYGYVNLAESVLTWKDRQLSMADGKEILDLLNDAKIQAQDIQDKQALSYVLGYQGRLFELLGSQSPKAIDTAIDLTKKSLSQAQSIRADDVSYQWQYQLGRLFKAKGETKDAIAAYTAAFETLQNLRTDLIAANADQRFYFQDNIEPIYRDLVKLLLTSDNLQTEKAKSNSSQPSQTDLRLVRRVMDALQEGELENFFQSACIDSTTQLGEFLKPGEAGIYTIVLDDRRLDVILELPASQHDIEKDIQKEEDMSTLTHFSYQTTQGQTIEQLIKQIQINLDSSNPGASRQLRTASREVYNYVFQATEDGTDRTQTLEASLDAALANDSNKTLIFVLDGSFRTIPLGILYDGERYLLEKYAIALNLGIEIREPKALPPGSGLNILLAGVEKPLLQGFERDILPNVPKELESIQEIGSQIGATVDRVPEQDFSTTLFNQRLNTDNYQIVHLATHGQFASSRDDTFILAKEEKIQVDELSQLFRNTQAIQNPVEMLVFSACRTATGDDRAVLGLAGATVQAGARSAIATLWGVDDAASLDFAESLYEHLGNPEISRAVALQKAQLELRKKYRDPEPESNPYNDAHKFWAPYVLVGSWR